MNVENGERREVEILGSESLKKLNNIDKECWNEKNWYKL